MTDREVMQMALEALEGWWDNFPESRDLHDKVAITALRKALEQQAEPVIPAHLDVRKILLAVTPGDGSGHEVYAKSVNDVVDTLTKLDERLERLEQQAEPDRRDLQAAGTHPAPCARHCEAKAFEIEIRSLKSQLKQQAEPCQFCGLIQCDPRCMWIQKDIGVEQAEPVACPIGLDEKGASQFCSAGYCDACKQQQAAS